MKMMIAILNDRDCEQVMAALDEAGFDVTQVASTGGFLRRGNATLLVGMKEEQVENAIDLIRATTSAPDDGGQRRATLFVLDVAHYEDV